MARKTINISLPPDIYSFVEARIAAGEYGSTSEYFRFLIKLDKQRLQDESRQERRREEAAQYGYQYHRRPRY
jgi:putative addiction module CopG family antidote